MVDGGILGMVYNAICFAVVVRSQDIAGSNTLLLYCCSTTYKTSRSGVRLKCVLLILQLCRLRVVRRSATRQCSITVAACIVHTVVVPGSSKQSGIII